MAKDYYSGMIYQLLKTSPYLTGQVRLDLVADHLEGDSNILLDELHVVPINDSIWYNCPEDQINFKHSENISGLYKAIEDKFYSPKGDTILRGNYPYYSTDDTDTDTVDHTYQMGLRRISVSRYGKGFSFMLPMWIDEECIDRLSFFATVYPTGNPEPGQPPTPLTTRKLEMSERLKNYLKEWFAGVSSDLVYIGLMDQTAYITGLDAEKGSTVTKDISQIVPMLLDRERPLIETDNMISRQFSENGIIAKQLVNFNFFFNIRDFFSPVIEDTVMWNPINVVVEARIDSVPVETKDLYTNYWDIYSYKISDNPIHPGTFVEGIETEVEDENGDMVQGIQKFNVLDYLSDTNCIDLVSVNKMVQPNFHWAFVDNPKYTWNLYNGFSPLVEEIDGETNSIHRVEGRFFGTPDIMSEEYTKFRNNIQWITVIDGTEDVVPGSFVGISMSAGSTTRFKPNQFGTFWSKGIKFNISDTLDRGYTGDTPAPAELRVNICTVRELGTDHLDKDKMYAAVRRNIEGEPGSEVPIDYVSIVAVVDGDIKEYWGLNNLTYQGVRKLLSGGVGRATQEEENDVFLMLDSTPREGEFRGLFVIARNGADIENIVEESTPQIQMLRMFRNVLETVEYPSIIRFQKTLGTRLAPAPTIDKLIKDGSMDVKYTTEIEYRKVDEDYSTYLFRYGGSIIPQFIDTEIEYTETREGDNSPYWKTVSSGAFNMVFKKRQWKDLNQNERKCLNYISKQKYQPVYPSIDYFYIDGELQDGSTPYIPENYGGEVCWFLDNMVYFVPSEFTLVEECSSEEMTDDKKLEMFRNYIFTKGYFKMLVEHGQEAKAKNIVDRYIWKLYTNTSDWEYSSVYDIDLYKFKVTYSLI